MNDLIARGAIRQLALREGVSEEEIVSEIEASIYISYRTAIDAGDREKVSKLLAIPHKGELPNAYEFISYAAAQVQRQKEKGV